MGRRGGEKRRGGERRSAEEGRGGAAHGREEREEGRGAAPCAARVRTARLHLRRALRSGPEVASPAPARVCPPAPWLLPTTLCLQVKWPRAARSPAGALAAAGNRGRGFCDPCGAPARGPRGFGGQWREVLPTALPASPTRASDAPRASHLPSAFVLDSGRQVGTSSSSLWQKGARGWFPFSCGLPPPPPHTPAHSSRSLLISLVLMGLFYILALELFRNLVSQSQEAGAPVGPRLWGPGLQGALVCPYFKMQCLYLRPESRLFSNLTCI